MCIHILIHQGKPPFPEELPRIPKFNKYRSEDQLVAYLLHRTTPKHKKRCSHLQLQRPLQGLQGSPLQCHTTRGRHRTLRATLFDSCNIQLIFPVTQEIAPIWRKSPCRVPVSGHGWSRRTHTKFAETADLQDQFPITILVRATVEW